MDFNKPHKVEPQALTPGQRISIAGKPGTFVSYARMKNFPNCIRWLPDGLLEICFTIWSGQGKLIKGENDHLDPLAFDIEYWEFKYHH